MDHTERAGRLYRRAAFVLIAILILCLAAAACAAEKETHTVVLKCGGSGSAGIDKNGKTSRIAVTPEAETVPSDGRKWTLEELRQLPDFRVECAALRFTVTEVNGLELRYALTCGEAKSSSVSVRDGRNLWDVTKPFSAWLDGTGETLSLDPMYTKSPWGMKVKKGSFSIRLTFSTTAKLGYFPLDRIRCDDIYENSLSMLEADSPFIARYDETAESLMTASLPLGVPYYYAGGNEDKFLHRYFPRTTTNYYQDTHMYLCGLDCVGMTRLVYENSRLERHPSIVDILHRGIAHSALKKTATSRWRMLLQPGDLVAVRHGTYHVMMYLGTMRMFGWTEADAGEAAGLLDEPLFIHCGGNPFYYERYQKYIRDMKYRNTMPPDGGVTVSVVRQTDRDAPHSTDTSWGKHFGWYELGDGKPLLVFRLEDCTDIAWYGSTKIKINK